MTSRDDLIASLSSDLAPVKPVGRVEVWASAWLLASGLYVVAIIHLMGPVRPEAMAQLTSQMRFLAEMLIGATAIALLTLGAFRSSVPGLSYQRLTGLGAALLMLWISLFLVGLEWPALEPSMSGKRHYCVVETFLYAMPPVLLAYFILRRFYPLNMTRIAATVCLAAGMLPALYMQVACMYIPAHILKFHVVPGLAVGAAGAALALLVTRRARNSRNNT